MKWEDEMYRVVKRDGSVVDFDIAKISSAITKAFEALGKQYHSGVIDLIAIRVTADFEEKVTDGQITVEDIQDSVEKVLYEAGYADVYNMEVEGNHNFAINGGLIVHNCMDSMRYFVKTMRIAVKREQKYYSIIEERYV